jgi:uncharacterized repeat protein (TIGR02543 family)
MGFVNKRVFNKAYMLEFIGEKKPIVFTFSIPPKGEEFDFGQRLTETKTFGGSVFDNYGNDTIKINLSGSTGNTEKKFIYRGFSHLPMYLDGEAEIFELQKTIYNWHKLDADKLNTERKVYLYDLSKMNIVELATLKPSRNYWRVYIKDLKVKRDDSKPFQYNYTLEMLGLAEEQEKKKFSFKDAASIAQGFTNAMNTVQSVMNYTEMTISATEECVNEFVKVQKACSAFANMSTEGQVLSVFKNIDSATRILTGNSNNTFYNAAKSCLSVANQCGWVEKKDKTSQKSKTQDTSSYMVRFESNGGGSVKAQTVEYSKTVTRPTNPTKDKYTFVDWFSDSALTTVYDFNSEVTGAFTLYAKWQLATATILFNSKGGSSVTSQLVAVGKTATAPTAPTRNGYSFVKWCTDYAATSEFDFSTAVTGDMTLYAAWQQVYSVSFSVDGGSAVAAQTVKAGGLAVYPITPTKTNYTFSCWCTDSSLSNVFDFATPITTNTTLYAKWIQYSNTVTFDSNGGSAVAAQNVKIGGYATEPTKPTRTGFVFDCWCTDSSLTNEFHFDRTTVNSAMTLYAKWSTQVLTVSFDTNGGSTVDSQSVSYNGKAIFPDIPTKEGSVFEMWRMLSGETYTEFDFNSAITADVTLYAKWFGE